MSTLVSPPAESEYAEYYRTYVSKVPTGNIHEVLASQLAESVALYSTIDEAGSMHRYAPGKWSIRQSLSHTNDTERVFTFRALWFARGYDSELPSFDQDIAVAAADADGRSWSSHIDEFRGIRSATIALFANLPTDAWSRSGIASGNRFTVRSLAWITAGHVQHHLNLLKERYL